MAHLPRIDDLVSATRPSSRVVWVFFGILLLAIFSYILHLANYDLGQLFSAFSSQQSIHFIAQAILALIISVVAAFSYTFFEKRNMKSGITALSRLAPDGLLDAIFEDIAYYDNRYLLDFSARARMEPMRGDPNLIRVQVEYSYKKRLKSRELRFIFARDNEHAERRPTSAGQAIYSLDNYLQNELYLSFDENGFPDSVAFESLSEFYRVRSLFVQDSFVDLHSRIKGEEYVAQVPSHIPITDPVEIRYTVEFPMERDSYFAIVPELPARNVKCYIDYAAVKDQLDVYAVEYLTAAQGPVQNIESDTGEVTMEHKGWIVPKSSFVMIWFEKQSRR